MESVWSELGLFTAHVPGTCTMCFGIAELIMQFQEEVDWMKVLETALRESEKMVLPLAIFKVKIVFIKKSAVCALIWQWIIFLH